MKWTQKRTTVKQVTQEDCNQQKKTQLSQAVEFTVQPKGKNTNSIEYKTDNSRHADSRCQSKDKMQPYSQVQPNSVAE